MNVCKGIGSNLRVQLIISEIHMWKDQVVIFIFYFILFYFFMFFFWFMAFSLFICVFYYKNTMDGHRHKICVVLVFTMAIHHVIIQMVSMQRVAITQH
jgi:hypothetical protein